MSMHGVLKDIISTTLRTNMITKFIADELVKNNELFYRKDLKIDGVDVYIYNYLIVNHEAFKEDYSTELRGLTITHENAKERVFLSIPKFFNINELPETSVNVLKNKTIKKVQDKADGSMIQFIQINGNILAKTKQSFDNPQAKLAQSILDNSADLQFFILDCWANNYHPMFELIGPSNQHVVDYKEDNLVLIAVRDDAGHFIDIDKFNYKYCTESYDISKYTLNKMLNDQQTQKGTEGYVVKFTDETIVKIKTLDYIQKHRIQSESDSYKFILAKILNEEIDDIIGTVTEEKKREILKLEKLVSDYINHWTMFCFDASRSELSRSEMAEKYKTNRFFSVIMAGINKNEMQDIKDLIIKVLLKKYQREQKAKEFFNFLQEK